MLTRCTSAWSLRKIVAMSPPLLTQASYKSRSFPSVARGYSTTTSRRDIFKDERDAEWEVLRTGDPMEDDENAHLKDWDLVLKRACDVIDEVTEKQPHKTLHIYSQPDFVTTLGERTMFSIAGCTDDSTMFEATKDMKQYQDSVQMVDFTQPLPFRSQSHQLVICLCPPDRTDVVKMAEIARILNYEGYAIIGATGKMWKDQQLLPQLESLSDHLDVLSLQTTELNHIQSMYYLALVRAH